MLTSILQAVRPTLLSVAVLMAPALLAGCSRPDKSVTVFEDVTAVSGLESYRGMTHGAAWGDFDGDGLPDLYVTNHLNDANLFRNLGKGRFADVTREFFAPGDLGGDKHGAVWADFDNDGRLDLVQLTGAKKGVGSEPKRLFLNRGTKFEDVAESAGVSNPEGRTRMPLWFDLNRDGWLDLFQGAEARFDDKTPPYAFIQQDGKFVASEAMKFVARTTPFCIATELTGDAHTEILCRISGKNRTAQILDLAALPARDIDLLPATAFEDAAAADFDNDGKIDLYLARKSPPDAVAFGQPSDKEIIADVVINQENAGKPMGFTFRSSGRLSLNVKPENPYNALTPDRIHLGRQGAHPAGFTFDLSPDIGGMPPSEPGSQAGVYVGFTAPDKWEVRFTALREALAKGNPKYQQVAVGIASSAGITKIETLGDAVKPEEAPARLFMNRNGKLVEEGDKRGVNKRLVAGMNAVAGDFDNDMHVDLFVLASGDIGKQQNLLLLNRGDGHFDVVRAAGGAAGNRVGVGDSATTADFDGDGFLDLFMANGGSMGRSLGLPSERGGYRLYRNDGNGNHWIELDFEGTASNRDGIGAIVRVTAGGVTQIRVQDGGVHHRSQNHQRVHFGLAKHTQIDKIQIHWPSGMVQELNGVKADQILRIKEPAKSRGLTQ